ncbi:MULTISPECIES: hypothetical protein [unclassified Moorena]|nr:MULTISPECIES: hypothetical protein [unclassified Moorena]
MRYTKFLSCSLLSFPCSQIRCSLKPETLYLTKLQTAITVKLNLK